jgi:hypothetical protein
MREVLQNSAVVLSMLIVGTGLTAMLLYALYRKAYVRAARYDEMCRISGRLWELLDNIDTAADVLKPSVQDDYEEFYRYAMHESKKRHKLLESDGYKLYLAKKEKDGTTGKSRRHQGAITGS